MSVYIRFYSPIHHNHYKAKGLCHGHSMNWRTHNNWPTARKTPSLWPCGRDRGTDYCSPTSKGGWRHKSLMGNITIVGGEETNYRREISPLCKGQRHKLAKEKSHCCGRGVHINYCKEISALKDGQKHKLLGGKSYHCGRGRDTSY